MTENVFPSAWARSRTFSTTDDLQSYQESWAWGVSDLFIPGIGQDNIVIIDFLPCNILYNLIRKSDSVSDVIIDLATQRVFRLKSNNYQN